ncbi:hypothetical protein DH2020_047251 [Rehmannia glutinosa]|uniref:Cucumisin n=1 Tax=Rehmannia glutinosa TaxID=99300 RepID=A0ABR0U9A2_REHGL
MCCSERFVRQSLVRSYTRSFNGFAANLTVQEKEKLASHEQVVSIFPSTTFYPQTTRSWDFLGLAENVRRNPTVESDTIIGVIDTGVWPESESFNDKGFGPPPKKWKGACKGGKNFTCNNKVIGARYYNSKAPKDVSARDLEGHGSHCASIAAGNYVKGASFYGIAEGTARNCAENCLENSLVKGKIVLCRLIEGVDEAFSAGALGSVTALESVIPGLPLSDVSYVIPIAASSLQTKDFPLVESYFRSTKSPKVDIMKSESVKMLMPLGLLPDITAPGIEILAAYSPEAAPSDNYNDLRMVNYNILSGTSMSCPHVAGAGAYVKSFHPSWSPSAIKSALMTTAWIMDSRKDPLAEFAYGAGQIDPVKAVDPGLVYETFTEDYIKLLCSLGYDSTKLKQIFGVNTTCPAGPQTTPKDLNYPSMTSQIKTSGGNKNVTFSEKFARTVTNVGPEKSTYKVTTSTSPEYNITVTPNVLTFGATNEKKSFDVIISGKITNGKMVSASLEWSDGVHKVRSPIVVYPDNF